MRPDPRIADLARHDAHIAHALAHGGRGIGHAPGGGVHTWCVAPLDPDDPDSLPNQARRALWRRWVAMEHIGPVERWPRWWLLPGGAEELSARERLGE